MKTKLLYVEHKSGYSDDGPAWIGKGSFSKSGRTIYFNGQAFQSMKGAGFSANYYDLETGEEYWISGVKKNETNRHWAGHGLIQIDREVIEEFLALTGREKLNLNEFKPVEFSKEDVKSRINEGQNQSLLVNVANAPSPELYVLAKKEVEAQRRLSIIEHVITIEELRKEMPAMCEKYRIAYVDAFGSIARSEQKEDSDIDLIIEFSEPRRERISTRFFGFLHDVEDRFHHKVDLLTEKSLRNPILKEKVNQDRIRIYGN